MREQFEKIYADNTWKCGSGEGSQAIHNQGYIKFLNQYLRDHGIRSVVDMGCGDWQFSRFVNWEGIQYQGFDVVASVIENNKKQFESANVKFTHYSGDPFSLPEADLLLTKDVIQHWSTANVVKFLPMLDRYQHVLVTNCVNPRGITENRDIEDGDFRFLDLRLPPFNLPLEQVFEFTNRPRLLDRIRGRHPRWRKITLAKTKP